MGQTLPHGEKTPVFGASRMVDFELETAFITTDANVMGESIPINEAEDYIFGMVLLNDWSTRDIQKWESAPLGPFLSKNFATSISPWIITMDALEPFRTKGPKQDPAPFPYLQLKGKHNFDVNLEVGLQPENGEETIVTRSNYKYTYWSMIQQLVHHTSNGCRVNSGDMMGSGTISGPTPDSFGSMLELTWGGTTPIKLKDGTERKFINDGDTVTIKGYCKNNGVRIGFGEVSSKLLPPFVRK
jgi:fumarylacetoacetase